VRGRVNLIFRIMDESSSSSEEEVPITWILSYCQDLFCEGHIHT
jgi:hypothetical protein